MSGTSSHLAWNELPRTAIERFVLLLPELHEYHDGYRHSDLLDHFPRATPNLRRFMATALHQYLHAFYLASPAEAVPQLLRDVGRPDLADTLLTILNAPIGTTTYARILDEARNKFMAHMVPRFRHVRPALEMLDLDDPQVERAFHMVDLRLMRRTASVYRYLRRTYPEAVRYCDSEEDANKSP